MKRREFVVTSCAAGLAAVGDAEWPTTGVRASRVEPLAAKTHNTLPPSVRFDAQRDGQLLPINYHERYLWTLLSTASESRQ